MVLKATGISDIINPESEYVAATYTAKEALWLHHIMGEIFKPLEEPVTLHSNSQSAIVLIGCTYLHTRKTHYFHSNFANDITITCREIPTLSDTSRDL